MKKALILVALFIVLVVAGGFARRVAQTSVLAERCAGVGGQFDQRTVTCDLPDVSQAPVEVSEPSATSTRPRIISIDSAPDASTATTTKVVVSGVAPGTWYFEGSLPLKLVIDDVEFEAVATADGEWMTTNEVSFSATLEYPEELSGEEALLVIMKDNPSGLPENDDSEGVVLEKLP